MEFNPIKIHIRYCTEKDYHKIRKKACLLSKGKIASELITLFPFLVERLQHGDNYL
jgi:hypothetical protein